jgi:hypothetical protein
MSEVFTWDPTSANNNSSPPNGWPEGMQYSSVNNAAREMMGSIARWDRDTNGTLVSGGTSTGYTLTPNRTISSYTAGLIFRFQANHTNSGLNTLNVSALGAKSIINSTGDTSTTLTSGIVYEARYNGTQFVLSRGEDSAFDSSDIHLKRDFGAVGDGVTVETTKVQAFLTACAGRRGVIEAGTYLCDTMTYYSDSIIMGESGGLSVIKAISGLANTAPLLRNNVVSGTANTYYDKNCHFINVVFDGNNVGDSLGSRTAELVGASKMQNMTWERCQFRNVNYIGLAHGGCKNTRLLHCYLTDIGNSASLPVAGPALWFGNHGDGSTNEYVTIVGGLIEECFEAGGNLGANHVTVLGLQIKNVKEAGIFAAAPFHDHIYIGVDIEGVTRNYISSSGIEWGIDSGQIIGGKIAETEADNISLTDTQGIIINGVRLSRPARDAAYFTQASHISIITTEASPNQPRDITIQNCTPFSSSPTAYAFVNVGNSGDAPINVRIHDNNCDGQTYTNPSGKAVVVASGKRGAKFIQKDNFTGEDTGSITKRVTITAATGDQAITGIGFRPSSIELIATITSTSDMMQSTSTADCTAVGAGIKCAYIAGGAGGHRGATIDAKAINLVNPAGTDQVIATYASFDEDGFTINKTVAAVACEALIIARP